jgi:hypothetical protein
MERAIADIIYHQVTANIFDAAFGGNMRKSIFFLETLCLAADVSAGLKATALKSRKSERSIKNINSFELLL